MVGFSEILYNRFFTKFDASWISKNNTKLEIEISIPKYEVMLFQFESKHFFIYFFNF